MISLDLYSKSSQYTFPYTSKYT